MLASLAERQYPPASRNRRAFPRPLPPQGAAHERMEALKSGPGPLPWPALTAQKHAGPGTVASSQSPDVQGSRSAFQNCCVPSPSCLRTSRPEPPPAPSCFAQTKRPRTSRGSRSQAAPGAPQNLLRIRRPPAASAEASLQQQQAHSEQTPFGPCLLAHSSM